MRYVAYLKKDFQKMYIELRKGIWKLLSAFVSTLTVSTKQGKYVLLTKDKIISRSLFSSGQYERDLMKNYFEYLKVHHNSSGGVIVDIGANMGVTTVTALLNHDFEKAVSIEPEPKNFEVLQKNVRLNGLETKVHCIQCAVSNKAGTIDFELSEDNYGDHRVRITEKKEGVKEKFGESKREVITVESDTLDTILTRVEGLHFEDISLIWIDVQGFEGYVFQGAQKIFSTKVPVVSELWPYGIYRTGMSKEVFCGIAESIWTHVIVPRRNNTFVTYPISYLTYLMDELSGKSDYENVIFIKKE